MDGEFREIVRETGLSGGSRLLVAVSGGVDSVVLLDLFAQVATQFGLRLQVLHLDHLIRPESAVDAEFVRTLCARLDVPCRIETVDVPALARKRRLSLETAGREARREALLGWAEEHGCAKIVLAHHQDDQAETFLQRLLRGSGRSGLRGMSVLEGLWWRPLLGFSRRQVLAYAEQRKLDWVEDLSNTDTAFQRNRIRHRLLPELREYNPRITQRLTSLSRQFQLEEDFWQQHMAAVWPGLLSSDADGMRLDRRLLLECHPALQLRLVREGLRLVRGDLRAIETVHLDALLGLLLADRPQAELDLPGCWAARRYGQLWLRRSAPKIEGFDLLLEIDQPLLLPDGRTLVATMEAGALGENLLRVEFSAEGFCFPLQVRSPRPGDRFQPSGMLGRHQRLKDYMIDNKIDKEARQNLPLLLNQGEILWLVGRRRSSLAPIPFGSREILAVQLIEGAD